MPIKPGASVPDVEGIYIHCFGNLATKCDPMVRPGSMDRYASTIGKVHHGAAGSKRLSQAVFLVILQFRIRSLCALVFPKGFIYSCFQKPGNQMRIPWLGRVE